MFFNVRKIGEDGKQIKETERLLCGGHLRAIAERSEVEPEELSARVVGKEEPQMCEVCHPEAAAKLREQEVAKKK